MNSGPFSAVKISENVYWVGAVDWTIRDFHGYLTQRGTTYNAYLVMADKITLVDTVKRQYLDEMKSRIASVIDPKKIDYVVSNHAEMDHSGCLPEVIEFIKPEKIFASTMGQRALVEHFHFPTDTITPVKEGSSLDLGSMKLTFIETRMLHWPDSMVSYLDKDKILFSQDGFGMHLAANQRFADEMDQGILYHEAAKYYANILNLYSDNVVKILEKINHLNLSIDMIAPDHGPIWRRPTDVQWILGLYSLWASQKKVNKAVIICDTMWGSTCRMGREILESISGAGTGTSVKMMPLGNCHRSEIATEVLDAKAIIVGSPTLNNGIFPTVADIMCYLKGLRPKNLIGTSFGSYGWSGEATKIIRQLLTDMSVEVVADPVTAKYVPTDDNLEKCRHLGQLMAAKITESDV